MPDHNPYIAHDHADQAHGSPYHFLDLAPLVFARTELAEPLVNPSSSQNAAGSAEDVARHVALVVACAIVGVYVLRASGFKFVVAGSVG